jgi:hypothetical protein
VRDVLKNTVQFTSDLEDYKKLEELPQTASFFDFQKIINTPVCAVPSHVVIDSYICKKGADYRFETKENPIPALRNRREDNTCVGRVEGAAQSTEFKCNE